MPPSTLTNRPIGIVASVTAVLTGGTEAVSVSTTVIASLTEMDTDVGGSDGGPAPAPKALSGTDCVKFDPEDVLVRLLKLALSVKVMVPVGVPGAFSE